VNMSTFWSGFFGVLAGGVAFAIIDYVYCRKAMHIYTEIGDLICNMLRDFDARLKKIEPPDQPKGDGVLDVEKYYHEPYYHDPESTGTKPEESL
jgi:hypothetical protein